jgi:hypothetical protein
MFSVIACLADAHGETAKALDGAHRRKTGNANFGGGVTIGSLILFRTDLMKRTLPAGLIMRTYHSSVFPLRKTLLALTIGAISHSATAAENVAEEKAKKRWSFRPHPPAILKPAAIWWCPPISTVR